MHRPAAPPATRPSPRSYSRSRPPPPRSRASSPRSPPACRGPATPGCGVSSAWSARSLPAPAPGRPGRRPLFAVGGLHKFAPHLQVGRMRRHVPVGERPDEPQQRLPQLVVVLRRLPHGAQGLSRLPLEWLWTAHVARIRQQQCQQHHAAGRQRPTRPPEMQRRRMPVADRLFPRRVLRHQCDRKVDFSETLAGSGNHTAPSSEARSILPAFSRAVCSHPCVDPFHALGHATRLPVSPTRSSSNEFPEARQPLCAYLFSVAEDPTT